MRVAILGVTGMLGSAVHRTFLQENFELVPTTRKDLDAQSVDDEALRTLLQDCDYAINCIGIIKSYIHDDNAFEVQRAVEVNALFPHRLATVAQKTGTKVLQIATDCVYDGLSSLYNESAQHNALDVYGKTKSLGEVQQENVMNLRCSIIGREEKCFTSLLEWFLHQPQGAHVKGFENHFWNGVTTNAFTKICSGIIKHGMFKKGTYHVVPKNILSKYEMLHVFAKHFSRQDIVINKYHTSIAVDRTLSTIYAEDNENLWKTAGYEHIPSIEEMIQEMSI